MTNSLGFRILVALGLTFIITGYIFNLVHQPALASAPSGLQADATSATSTALAMASQAPVLMFATSTCSARVVTTTAQPVMLTFSDDQGKRPTGIYGHLVNASTTATFDSGLYGCGAMYGFSNGAQTVSITELR